MFIGKRCHSDNSLEKDLLFDPEKFVTESPDSLSNQSELELISCSSVGIPSIDDNEEKYVNLPSKSINFPRPSLKCVSDFESYAMAKEAEGLHGNARLNLVGCLENYTDRRVMITISPYESFYHLTNLIGQQLQHYPMFQNLLGLKATELKVIKRNGEPCNDGVSVKFGRKGSKINEEDQKFRSLPIEKVLQDGDEFVFKITSSDKWINCLIQFKLEDDPDFTFSAKSEMRISGFFQNSHFFLIITKLIMKIWNENAKELLGKEDYYTITDINFRNRKVMKEILDQSKHESSIIELEPPRNGLMNSIRDLNKEIEIIDVKKMNYLEVPIDPQAKTSDTFGYDGTILVNVTFATIQKVLKDGKLQKDKNAIESFRNLVSPEHKNILEGCIALPKKTSNHEHTNPNIAAIQPIHPKVKLLKKSASFESVDVDLESNIGSKDISKLDSDRSHNDTKRRPSICTRSINYTSSESSERSSIKDPLLSPNDIGKVRSQVYGSAVKSKSKKKPIMEICKDIPPMKLNFNALNTSGDSLAPLEKVNRFSGMSINKKDEIQKKLVHLRIDPILIYKHEYDLLRLPETRGHKINFEAKVEDQPSQFEIVEKYGQTIRRNFKNCGLWIIALLILLVFTFCVIIYIK
ncbi:unnamed protein product [Moneuplotes crassus]|uniref:Uncharacterized protein n=1 Tax=Euplotes crassus TaxID=5936 RepID=A0AAD2DCM9_EUPCR|nr:unnamed protein product [Moneuplotes crassus]